MKLNKLKAKIVELGMNVETLADKIGMERSTLYRNLNMTDAEATDIFLS